MNQIDIFLRHLTKTGGFLYAKAVLLILLTADTDFNDHVLTHPVPNRFQDPQGKFRTVFDASAVFIRSVVVSGRQELMQQPAVTGMDLNTVKAGRF